MKYSYTDFNYRGDKEVEVWACAYSTYNTEKNMAFKCPPVKGVTNGRYFKPYGKNGKPLKSKEVRHNARTYFDNEKECVDYYNSRIQSQIDKLQELINDCKKDFVISDFDLWYKYGDKTDYSWILDDHTAVRKFIDERWDLEKYMTVTLDDILESIEEYTVDDEKNFDEDNNEDNRITADFADFLKQELMELNFGSCVWDW